MTTTTTMTALAATPLDAYNLETYLFARVGPWFRATGELSAMDLARIFYWKAPRAAHWHFKRLERQPGGFAAAVAALAFALRQAPTREARLLAMITDWGFRLPTASAVLTVLWPDDFTVYDVRVCDALKARDPLATFHALAYRKTGHALWLDYERFLQAVVAVAPPGLSLRDADRWLWGADATTSLVKLMQKHAPSTAALGSVRP